MSKNFGTEADIKNKITLVWERINAYVPNFNSLPKRSKYRRILRNVNGIAKPGSLIGILGPSGSGKTTLLEILSGRASRQIISTGKILANRSAKPIQNISGFLYQQDFFYENITPYEHLLYQARFRISKTLDSHIKRRIGNLLLEFNLSKCKDYPLHSLSGGEKRRVAFISEILTSPNLLFCDEPVTGLDNFSAKFLINEMLKLAQQGKTIICTIHQPSSSILQLFTHIILLSRGQELFFGSIENALKFFKEINLPCPENFNPAHHFLSSISVVPGEDEKSERKIQTIMGLFKETKIYNDRNLEVCLEVLNQTTNGKFDRFKSTESKNKVRILETLFTAAWLAHRGFINYSRDQQLKKILFVQKVIFGILFGLFYLNTLNPESYAGIQSTQGILFIITNELINRPCLSMLVILPQEYPILFREVKMKMYPIYSYVIGTILHLIPRFILEIIIQITLTYWISGLRNSAYAYFMTLWICFLTNFTSAAFGFGASAVFFGVRESTLLLNPIFALLMIMSGSVVLLRSIPSWIAWIRYVCWSSYAMEGLSILQWKNREIRMNNTTNDGGVYFGSGSEILDYYGFTEANLFLDIFGLHTLFVTFICITYICLRRRLNQM